LSAFHTAQASLSGDCTLGLFILSGYVAEPTDLMGHAAVRSWHLADILFAELDVRY
jgi:hypothetical protein